ncbi:hypothetical protein H4R34_003786 [Dimargaris verticillata]|uniref:Thioesterase domain-containing protein n=1 Tax=Dimargaris verticillata TaxID=2761393 RepID=A0A9W8B5J8_9FUNG|nr:hypothetical protein H4R34_003786 [Dimargaris verticillata]
MTGSPGRASASESQGWESSKSNIQKSVKARPPLFAADLYAQYGTEHGGGAPSSPRSDQGPNTSEQTLLQQALQERIDQLPLVQALRAKVDAFHEFFPYWPVDDHALEHHLTMTALSGHRELPLFPVTFRHPAEVDPFAVAEEFSVDQAQQAESHVVNGDGHRSVASPHKQQLTFRSAILDNTTDTAMTQIQYLGRSLCGHDGIVHGGLLATIFDEAFARIAFSFLPGHIGFTANLNVDYRLPVPADIMVVLVVKVESVQGRKVLLSAAMKSLDGQHTFTEAKSLYISPRPKTS